MLNIAYFKGQPTEHILKYGAGKLRKEGPGLAFFYWKHSTQIVSVPTSSVPSSSPWSGTAWIRSSTPSNSAGAGSIPWRHRAIDVFPDEDTPFSTMTWWPTAAR